MPKHRANLRKALFLHLLLQRLDLALLDFLRENGPRLAHQVGKNPRILAAACTDVGNGRAFAQTQVGEDRAERVRPLLRFVGLGGRSRLGLLLGLVSGMGPKFRVRVRRLLRPAAAQQIQDEVGSLCLLS